MGLLAQVGTLDHWQRAWQRGGRDNDHEQRSVPLGHQLQKVRRLFLLQKTLQCLEPKRQRMETGKSTRY